MSFLPARAKLTIGSLDEPNLTVKAHYNPKELQISKQIPWKPHNENDKKALSAEAKSRGKQDSAELTGPPTRSMSIELMFDGYETGASIEPFVHVLEELSSVRNGPVSDEKKRRPHFCVVVWGDGGIAPFRCIIEQLVVKYSMFSTNGVPLRASCTVTLKEASLRCESPDASLTQVRQKSFYEARSRAIKLKVGGPAGDEDF